MNSTVFFLGRQLILQCCAVGAALLLMRFFPPPVSFLVATGICGLLLSLIQRNPWWWHFIHFSFMPAVLIASTLTIQPSLYFILFVVTGTVFIGTLISRVPLYLTGTSQLEALLSVLNEQPIHSFADLGAGIGSTLAPVAKRFPHVTCTGYEISPASTLFGFLRCLFLPNTHWHLGNLSNAVLSHVDVAYAYLSPAPMTELWEKVSHEMKPGSIFVSNSFPVQGIEPEHVLLETSIHPLYLYRIPDQGQSTRPIILPD